MTKSKSPKKDGAEPTEADHEMRERARKGQADRSKKKQDILDKYAYHIVFTVFGVVMLLVLINAFWKSGPDVHTTDVNDADYIASRNA
jgi:hypothetical protein